MNVDIIILAAGQGKRMQSPLPKVLQSLGGKPLLQHVVDTCSNIEKAKLHIIVGEQKKLIQSSISAPKSTNWIVQKKPLINIVSGFIFFTEYKCSVGIGDFIGYACDKTKIGITDVIILSVDVVKSIINIICINFVVITVYTG